MSSTESNSHNVEFFFHMDSWWTKKPSRNEIPYLWNENLAFVVVLSLDMLKHKETSYFQMEKGKFIGRVIARIGRKAFFSK